MRNDMKKNYKKPLAECTEVIERYGVLVGDSGEVDPGEHSFGKENSLVWDEEGSFNLWENDEDDDNLWNNE